MDGGSIPPPRMLKLPRSLNLCGSLRGYLWLLAGVLSLVAAAERRSAHQRLADLTLNLQLRFYWTGVWVAERCSQH